MAAKKAKPTGSITSLAQKLGVTRPALENAISKGAISPECFTLTTRGHRKVIDVERAELEFRDYLTRDTKKVTLAGSSDGDDLDLSGVDFSDTSTWPKNQEKLRVIREFHQAAIAKQKAELQAGSVLPREQVERDLASILTTLRSNLQLLPARLSAQVGADKVLERALASAIDSTLIELSKDIEGLGAVPAEDMSEA